MTFKPKDFTVWMEIPVTDLDKSIVFYNAVFQTDLQLVEDEGPNLFAIFPTADETGVGGHLYPGTPPPRGAGPTIHLQCPDGVEATMKRFEEAGGEIVSPVINIPSGKFAYGIDLDGNSIGLFAK